MTCPKQSNFILLLNAPLKNSFYICIEERGQDDSGSVCNMIGGWMVYSHSLSSLLLPLLFRVQLIFCEDTYYQLAINYYSSYWSTHRTLHSSALSASFGFEVAETSRRRTKAVGINYQIPHNFPTPISSHGRHSVNTHDHDLEFNPTSTTAS